jgi:hypothetical protein
MSFSGNFINAGNIEPAFSSTGGSATGDWYNHQQTLDIQVERENVYDSQLSTITSTPSITRNRLRVDYQYTVNRSVDYSTTYGGSIRTGHQFSWVGGNIGLSGNIDTSEAGFVRRIVRTDARTGAMLDSLNDCNSYGTFYMDHNNGVWDGVYANNLLNQIVLQAATIIHSECPKFSVSLLNV